MSNPAPFATPPPDRIALTLAQARKPGSRGPARVLGPISPWPVNRVPGECPPTRGSGSYTRYGGTPTEPNPAIVQQGQWLRRNWPGLTLSVKHGSPAQPRRSGACATFGRGGNSSEIPSKWVRKSPRRGQRKPASVFADRVPTACWQDGLTPPASRPCGDRRKGWLQKMHGSWAPPNFRRPASALGSHNDYRHLACGLRRVQCRRVRSRL